MDHLGRRGHHVGTDLGGLQDVGDVAHRCDQDFGGEVVVVIDQADVLDQIHPVEAVIIMPPDKRRDECRPGLGREQRLIGRETQRHIDHRAFAGQRLAGFQPVHRQGHLDADIVGDLAQHLGLFHHRRVVQCDHFGADRAIDNAADFARHLHEIPPRFGDQRRVGGDAVQQAGGSQFADRFDLGGVDKEFHGFTPIICR